MTDHHPSHLLHEELTRSVIGSFFDVHRGLGFGYREFIYSLALERELIRKGHRDREVSVMVYYRGDPLATQTLDMIVDERSWDFSFTTGVNRDSIG